MIDGPYECISTNIIDDTKIAELDRLVTLPGSSTVLIFSLDKLQIGNRAFNVSLASIVKEQGTGRRLLMLSVTAPTPVHEPAPSSGDPRVEQKDG